ncbi:hypothetical protein BsWGS_21343 [Bradybaena similaris]
MEYEDVKKSLWHAFDLLDTSSHSQKIRSSQVPKTKLRVLTNNLGRLLGVDKAETIWDKVADDSINFTQFIQVLSNNLLVGIDKNPDTKVASLKAEIDHLCWMLCEKSYLQQIKSNQTADSHNGDSHFAHSDSDITVPLETVSEKEFPKDVYFKLWKIFNYLVERAQDGNLLFPLRADVEEAERIAELICQTVGLPVPKNKTLQRTGSVDINDDTFLLNFSEFVKLILQRVSSQDDFAVVSQGIAEVYEQIVSDIVRKGNMAKFGNKVTAWKERWFVLTASTLRYYASSDEKDLKGSIAICPQCFIQSFPDRPGGKQHRFKLSTPSKHYELSAPDLKSKNMWMADLKKVITNIGQSQESLQRQDWKERKKEREERRRRTAEEEMKRCQEQEKLQMRERELENERKQRQLAQEEIKERDKLLELERKKRAEEEEKRHQETNRLLEEKRLEIEAEKLRCVETEARLQKERELLVLRSMEALEAEREQRALVEARLKEEEAQLEEERRRLRELEEAKAQLESLVEEERALKRDEEIVRKLQAQILEEESAKREILERLQAEQGQQLLKEQMSRQELEEAHRQQEEAFRLAREQLEALAKERQQADEQLREASEKLLQAEKERLKLEERMKLKELSSSTRLAGPLPKSDPNPFVTHRGLGAFSEADFVKNH